MRTRSTAKKIILNLLAVPLVGLTFACGVPVEQEDSGATSASGSGIDNESKPKHQLKKSTTPATNAPGKTPATKTPATRAPSAKTNSTDSEAVDTPKQKFAKWLYENDVKTWAERQTKAYLDIGGAAARLDIPDMVSACRALGKNTKKAQAWPPAPDARYEKLQASALKHAAKASKYCIAAWENDDESLFDKSAHEIKLSGKYMKDSGARFQQIVSQR